MSITVRDALKLTALEKAEVLTGEKGLDREIKYVTVMDAPDSVDWLKGNEFLITAGYVIKNDLLSLEKLIEDLVAANASALGIKLRRYIDEIPPESVEFAKEKGLPIVVIPFESRWIDIINAVHTKVLSLQSELILKSEKIYKKFSLSLLKNDVYEQISRILYEIINHPIILVDSEDNLYFLGWEDENKVYLIHNKIQEIIENEILKEKKDTIEDYEGNYEFLELDIGEEKYKIIVQTITLANEVKGYIAVEESPGLRVMDYVSIEQAAIMCTLQAMITKSTKQIKRRFRNHFVEDLISGNFSTISSLQKRAEFFGWDINKNYAIMVVGLDGFENYYLSNIEKGEKFFQKKLEALFKTIHRINSLHNYDLITLDKSDSVIILLPIDKISIGTASLRNKIESIALEIQEKINNELEDLTVSIGIGRFSYDITRLAENYNQAYKALKYGRMVGGGENVYHFDDLGVFRLLCNINEKEELVDFYNETIAKLKKYDNENNMNLVDTLEIFYEYNSNIKGTAKAMFVHYNTIRYRLKKIKDIIGYDVYNGTDSLNLQVGIRIGKLL